MVHVVCAEFRDAIGPIFIKDKMDTHGLGDTPYGRGVSTDDLTCAWRWCCVMERCGCTPMVYDDQGHRCVVEDGDIEVVTVVRGLVVKKMVGEKPVYRRVPKSEVTNGS